MRFFAPAKLNLVLNIGKKDKKDGYHFLESVFEPVSLFDELDIEITRAGVEVVDKFNTLKLPQEKNIVYKAAMLMMKKYGISKGVKVTLYKYIPNGAGLGGGSSDAATVILAINRIFKLRLSSAEMAKTARKIGSDVPFFIYQKRAFVSGKGEKIRVLKVKKPFWFVIIVHKAIKIATKDAYKWFDAQTNLTNDKSYTIINSRNKKDDCGFLYNNFEPVVYGKFPILLRIKESFLRHGCLDSSLSGSGSAVFALFKDRMGALKCLKKVSREWKGSFICLARSI